MKQQLVMTTEEFAQKFKSDMVKSGNGLVTEETPCEITFIGKNHKKAAVEKIIIEIDVKQ